MFERFTVSARGVVVLAQEQHRLLGLSTWTRGRPVRCSTPWGVHLEPVRAEVRRTMIPPAYRHPAGHIPFTPGATPRAGL